MKRKQQTKRILTEKEQKVAIDFLEELIFANTAVPEGFFDKMMKKYELIVWPEPTHGKGLKPYRTAAECIDWSIPCPSIFGRKKDLAVNTQRRIARGLEMAPDNGNRKGLYGTSA